MRCCRGLRPNTLAKRVRDWRPFQRFLLAHGMPTFPTCADHVLRYFEVREQENAPRTCYECLLQSLRFFEEAGERPAFALLHKLPAVTSAAKEAAAARALDPENK